MIKFYYKYTKIKTKINTNKNKMDLKNLDILAELDKEFEALNKSIDERLWLNQLQNSYTYEVNLIEKPKKNFSFYNSSIFLVKYLVTSFMIFAVLLVWTNYSAYINLAKWFFFQGEYEKESANILSSVEASVLKEKTEEKISENSEETSKVRENTLSIKKYKKELDEKPIPLNIEITPYENRIVIPKLWKNIPLVDIKNRQVDSTQELENIFMEELENGVVRYPGTALPGQEWNAFIFWHSSNFPWMNGSYNDVFSNLNFLDSWDEVIIYYNQKKFIYKIKEKKVIKPGDVSILKRDAGKKELSIMTCWPIWTTLNRLIVIGELVEEN